jgi:hypothetical protein
VEDTNGAPRSERQIGEHEGARFDGIDNAPLASTAARHTAIRFYGPASVIELLQCAVSAYRERGEPAWYGMARLLLHVVRYWESLPKHRDPVFERDGWRCGVPGCTSRCNLHDHHVVFRSRGGGNERDNRVAVCAGHHQRGIHDMRMRATGLAPHGIVWELGLRATGPPLMRLLGDAYLDKAVGERCGVLPRPARSKHAHTPPPATIATHMSVPAASLTPLLAGSAC